MDPYSVCQLFEGETSPRKKNKNFKHILPPSECTSASTSMLSRIEYWYDARGGARKQKRQKGSDNQQKEEYHGYE